MASLDKRGKNSYRLRWLEYGMRQQETFYADSYQDALNVKKRKEEELRRTMNSNLKMTDFWMLYRKARPRRGNNKHEEAYWNRVLEFFGDCNIHQITKSTLNDYKNWLSMQPFTRLVGCLNLSLAESTI